ncbi:DUF2071 domain-containing protein [Luedemannella helvata]|uniref:YqjF family protein n=1 Tax=Luedemannella helvata TaxID=349315 RepID=A0ABP4VX74_9ACTN
MTARTPPDLGTAVMIQRWRRVSFLHWPYPVSAVQPLLPPGLTVQSFDATAWVGIIPLLMDGVRPPGVPPVPWLSRFPETNLRTYVTGPDGRAGIFFLSVDAARLPAVLGARASLGLPYHWSTMSIHADAGTVRYRGLRRGGRAGYDLVLRPGSPIEAGPLDDFLTARYRLYSAHLGRCVAVDVTHRPWRLRSGTAVHLHEDLVIAAGLPAPNGAPLVHVAEPVKVRIGLPSVLT